jgi:hypothetical protein
VTPGSQEQRATTADARSASFAIRLQYRGMERIAELPLTTHLIEQLAMEAAVRGVSIGDLIAELIMEVLNKGKRCCQAAAFSAAADT